MMPPTRSRRTDECLSDLQLDAILAGESGSDSAAAARAHMAECKRCLGRWTDVDSARRDFLGSHRPPVDDANRKSSMRRRSWMGAAAAVFAVAAGSMLWFRGTDEGAETGRTKGKSSLGFYVKHQDAVVRGIDGQVVHSGDRLRFVVRSPKNHVAILSVDGARNVSIYFPGDAHTASVKADQELALPESTWLDNVLGRETLYGVFCDAPTDLTGVRDRLRAEPLAAPTLPGCDVARLTIWKDP